MRAARPVAAALCALATLAAGPPAAELAERLAWNARERTATGVRELREGRPADAIGALDTALRLRPEDPVARFNAGTARIGVEPASAAEMLGPAASVAPEPLAPDAWYNLGNAQLAADDPDAAVKSYVQALRRRPAHLDTKFNLELALRRAEPKEKEQRDPQGAPKSGGDAAGGAGGEEGDSGGRSEEGEGDSSAGSSGPPNAGDRQQNPEAERGPRPETGDGGSDPADSPGAAPSPRDAPGPGERQGPLPRFRELPNMSAEQAAAILRAVDDLERRQRRERAQNAARLREVVEVDW